MHVANPRSTRLILRDQVIPLDTIIFIRKNSVSPDQWSPWSTKTGQALLRRVEITMPPLKLYLPGPFLNCDIDNNTKLMSCYRALRCSLVPYVETTEMLEEQWVKDRIRRISKQLHNPYMEEEEIRLWQDPLRTGGTEAPLPMPIFTGDQQLMDEFLRATAALPTPEEEDTL